MKNKHAQELGRLGGKVTGGAKAAAARINAKKPKTQLSDELFYIIRITPMEGTLICASALCDNVTEENEHLFLKREIIRIAAYHGVPGSGGVIAAVFMSPFKPGILQIFNPDAHDELFAQ